MYTLERQENGKWAAVATYNVLDAAILDAVEREKSNQTVRIKEGRKVVWK